MFLMVLNVQDFLGSMFLVVLYVQDHEYWNLDSLIDEKRKLASSFCLNTSSTALPVLRGSPYAITLKKTCSAL
jgi:hypothetical protein